MREVNFRHLVREYVLIGAGVLLVCSGALAQAPDRFVDQKVHRSGKLWVTVTNYGQIGGNSGRGAVWPGTDIPGREAEYINRGGWFFGAIVPRETPGAEAPTGLDTLVSEGPAAWSLFDFREMYPHFPDARSSIRVRSNEPTSEFFSARAVSPEDFISVYTDTFRAGGRFPFVPFKHQRPLGIEIEERSYQFGQSLAEDIVYFDLVIRNIGHNHLRNFFVGLFIDDDIGCIGSNSFSDQDDAAGFMLTNVFGDTVNTAWMLNADGDDGCLAGVVGVRFLRPASGLSFNWWSSDTEFESRKDWGPKTPNRTTGDANQHDPKGTPADDAAKYQLMQNGAIDYDQFDLARQAFSPNIPPGLANDPSRLLVAVGPIGTRDSIITVPGDAMFGETVRMFPPGDSVLVTLAIIGGAGDSLRARSLRSYDPDALLDLGRNSVIAASFFDTPGVDTDGDGFAGRDVDEDGLPDTGDGLPDFSGPQPPPSPPLTIRTADRSVILDWSAADPQAPGYDPADPRRPLNYRNPFLSDDPRAPADERQDFEGFRVLRSPTGAPGSFEILAEFDRADDATGRNTGLAFRYNDRASNGSVFYYAVVSYSRADPALNLPERQSEPAENLTRVLISPRPAEGFRGDVWVEPNPYREGHGLARISGSNGRTALDFVNVPANCTIRIYTPDGDLVRTLVHYDGASSRERWDLLNFSGRRVAGGLYIFSIELPNGERREGRFVILR